MNLWDVRWQLAKPNMPWYDKRLCILLGMCVLVFSSAFGTIANILCFRFFSTRQNVFFAAFRIVALCDIIISLLSTFYGLAYIFHRKRIVFFEIRGFCIVWTLFWETMVKASLYLVAIQSVLRTLKICYTALNISISILILTVTINFIVIIAPFVVAGVILDSDPNMKNQPKIDYVESFASCSGAFNEPPIPALATQTLLILLPMPIIIISCILCVCKLFQRNGVTINDKRKRSIVSLLVFSLTCLLLNVPVCLMLLQQLLQRVPKSGGRQGAFQSAMAAWFESTWMLWYGNGLIRRVSVSLNSVLNPFIYYWRMSDYRSFISARFNPARGVNQRVRELGYLLMIQMRRLLSTSNRAIQNQDNSLELRDRASQPAVQQADNSFRFIPGRHVTSSSRDITCDMTRDITRDMTRDITRDLTRHMTRDVTRDTAHYVTSRCSKSTGNFELEILVSGNKADKETCEDTFEDSGGSSQCQCECCFLQENDVTLQLNDRVPDNLLFSNLAVFHQQLHWETV